MKRALIIAIGAVIGLAAIGLLLWSAGDDGREIGEEELQALDELFMGRPALLQEIAM